ncbi:MAG TPA: hypothetical protein VLI55_03120 [Bryobacteraceae bacterium]|nr:hypothetical protein [Bryobacteraceae bacterium]
MRCSAYLHVLTASDRYLRRQAQSGKSAQQISIAPRRTPDLDRKWVIAKYGDEFLHISGILLRVLNDIGNWATTAPSLPAAESESKPSRVSFSSSEVNRSVLADVGSWSVMPSSRQELVTRGER